MTTVETVSVKSTGIVNVCSIELVLHPGYRLQQTAQLKRAAYACLVAQRTRRNFQDNWLVGMPLHQLVCTLNQNLTGFSKSLFYVMSK